MKKISLFLFVVLLSIVFISCGEKTKYTITYDLDGGTCDALISEYTEGNEVILPTPTKDGYIFLGWYQDEIKVEFVKKGNFELVAKWEKEVVENIKDKYDCITIAEAIEIAKNAGGTATEERYYVYGVVKTISNSIYGEMTIEDETGSIYVYGAYSADGKLKYSELEDKPIAGDEVVLYGQLKVYNDQPEMGASWIQAFKHVEVEIDENEYSSKSIKDTRASAAGTKVIVEGVVARITYANGFVPNGFYLVDNTGSIYVYGEVAGQVAVGNKIKLAGERIHYMASDAASNAAAFGYLGATQIANGVILENDKGTNDFDKSWIKESTVKEILETPASEDITSDIYKVNALVVKSVNPGFVNYYIDDLDGKTGSYVYTQCNGGDFSWLDEFDQKICTVYLSPLNAKVTTSSCQYRFIPVAVSFDNYSFDEKNAAQFALDYYAVDQFLNNYKSDPALEVVTTVNNELLGFNDVKLSYASSDESVIKFTAGETTVMNALADGTAEITITATYKTYTATAKLTINVNFLGDVKTITVKEAIDSENNTVCTIKGIVAASCVNQPAFYLIDETGVIAVRTTEEVLATLQVGNEVIMKGTKVVYESSKGLTQQICLLDSELVINYYGTHEYSKASFDSSKTLADLNNLSTDEFHTTQVYVLNLKVKFVEAQYYSNCYLTTEDGSVEILLYTSNGSQYNWLKELGDGVLTVELCLCDWNNKAQWRACVLSASNGEKTLNNTLNFK